MKTTKSKMLSVVSTDKVELSRPLECLWCGGHISIDISYIEQVTEDIKCLYCGCAVTVPLDC